MCLCLISLQDRLSFVTCEEILNAVSIRKCVHSHKNQLSLRYENVRASLRFFFCLFFFVNKALGLQPVRLHADYLLSSPLILFSSPSCHREPQQQERMRKYDFLSSLMPIKWGKNERGVLSLQERGFAVSVAVAVVRWLRAVKIISEGWWTSGVPHTQSLFVLRLLEGVFGCVTLFVSVSYNLWTRQIIRPADMSNVNHSKESLSQSANLIKKHCYYVHGWERSFQSLD